MKKFLFFFFIAVFALFVFAGCYKAPQGGPVVIVTLAPADFQTPLPQTLEPTQTPTEEPTLEPTPEPTPAPTPIPQTDEAWLRAYMETMTQEEKIGQLVMFGFSGTDSISSTFKSILQQYHVGNVILYGPNIRRDDSDGGFNRCERLTKSINSANISEIPLLISTDVEGGLVTRFKWPKWPTHASTLGSKNDSKLASDTFERIGKGLVNVGINTDLAPVLDVAKNPLSTFLEQRIISSKSEVVARIGSACIEGLHTGNCLSVVKHFPGHGATTADSHATTPVVHKSIDELRSYELIPFAEGLKSADGVMVAHILFPEVDSDIASMSRVWITEVLRDELEFDGFVMSDDFRMAGMSSRYKIETATVQFFLAGGDIILCGPRHELQIRIMSALTAAVNDGTISVDRLDESVFRILRAKMRVTDFNPSSLIGG